MSAQYLMPIPAQSRFPGRVFGPASTKAPFSSHSQRWDSYTPVYQSLPTPSRFPERVHQPVAIDTHSFPSPYKQDLHAHDIQKPIIDADKPGDENLGFLQRKCLKAIAWYQKRTRYTDENNHQVKNKLGCTCPYGPSCSSYTAEAIRRHGAIKGILEGAYRIFFKCNPITIFLTQGTLKVAPASISDPVVA